MSILDEILRMDIVRRESSVICRIDINSPLDPSGEIMDITRFEAHRPTIKELLEKGALKEYPVLVEVSGEKVAQAEDTIILK